MTRELQIQLYTSMLLIRRTEEAIAERYPEQEMRCPVHLSIGQEAVPVGLCAHLLDSDRIYSTHRCHAHYLAKGGDLNAMIAELYGKAGGCAEGKGGSMHLVAVDKGMMGASALVAGTIPLAVGSGLAFQLAKEPRVSVCFFGDGATEEGILYESLNFAALKKLPVIFACENNFYATYSPIANRQANPKIADRVSGFGLPATTVDGNDAGAVYAAASQAIHRARSGQGPTFFEFLTYRYRDHVGPADDIHLGYREREELEKWLLKCPIRRLRQILNLSNQQEEAIETRIRSRLESAFAFARQSPLPKGEEIYTDVYAD